MNVGSLLSEPLHDDELARLRKEAPHWFTAVDHAKEGKVPLLITLSAFGGEPELLYLALKYARELGVTVTFGAADTAS